MDAGPTRWVIVDDTSSDIRYLDGSWFSDVGNWDSVGSFGMPYLRTLHGINSSGSVKMDFTGSAVAVVGSNVGSKSKYWTCSVDEVAAESDVGTLAPICTSPCNNYLLCYATNLNDGNHTLTVNATPASNQTFWLDRIEYVPSPQASLEQKAIRVTPWDPALVGTKGKTFTFYGISVSWYGTITSLLSHSVINFSWSMDQADANYTWDWRGNSNASYPLQKQKLFETPTYPFGEHTLTVTDTVGFDYLIVQNGTVPTKSTSESYGTTNGPTSGILGPVGRGMPRAVEGGIIAGGVLGGILVFGITVVIFSFCRRRLRSQKETKIYLDALFFDQRPAHFSRSPQSYPVQRNSRTLPIHSHSSDIISTDSSHMHETNSMNESPITSGGTHNNTGTHGHQPQLMPSSAQPGAEVDVGQGDQPVPGHLGVATEPNSAVRSNGQVLATSVIHLPPEYTPN